MTAQPSSQAEREDVAREVLAEACDAIDAEIVREGSPYARVTARSAIAAMLAFSDREHAPDFALTHPEVYDLANATPRSMPEEVAADLLDQYADFIRRDVKADDLERHPYLPLIEQTVTDLRSLIPGASA